MSHSLNLTALYKYGILDSQPEKTFDDIVLIATQICETEMAAISFVDQDRQWFKSQIGFQFQPVFKSTTLFKDTFEHGKALIVQNVQNDPRYQDDPWVKSEPRLHFFAGVPLVTPEGHEIGVLFVADSKVKTLSPAQLRAFTGMASQVVFLLEGKLNKAPQKKSDVFEWAFTLAVHQKEALKKMIQTAPIVLWAVDVRGNFTFSDGKDLAKLGLSAGQIVGQSVFEVYKDVPQIVSDVKRALTGQEFSCETQVGPICFLSQYSPVWHNGNVTGVVGVATDISEQKKAEKERSQLLIRESKAQEASRIKSQFLANMSHEIRTPINGVLGMTGLLLETKLDSEQKEYLETIERSADGLLTVINDILDFSKVEAGQLDFEVISFDVRQTLQDTIRTLMLDAKKKGLIFVPEIELGNHQWLKGDPGRLRQVFTNLISNAIKFTERGKIGIRAKVIEECASTVNLRFEIQDEGIGISEGAIHRMFNPFSQAESSISRRFGGTGLGLSICKHLVERMGGKIGVESKVGVGSTFWFTVNLDKQQRTEKIDSFIKPKSVLPHFQNVKVLVAEDNSVNQTIAMKMLEKMGCKVRTVDTGLGVLRALADDAFDLILMDCQMPELDGFDTTRKIRSSVELACKDIPIIALTANAVEGDRERCLASGMTDYVSKPMKAIDLGNAILKCLPLTKIDVQSEAFTSPEAVMSVSVRPETTDLRQDGSTA